MQDRRAKCIHWTLPCSLWTILNFLQLFCGADEFSIHSLRALHALQQQHPSKIESLQVLCKKEKLVDRGLRTSRAPPIKAVANELGYRVEQIDNFRHWGTAYSYNIVIAVSFGLLIPKKAIEAAQYGGLNIHPSLLPDLRGAAPVSHALLKRRKETGVSLQTLHPNKFDHGIVLGQSDQIRISPNSTLQQLLAQLGPLGADLLCKGIEEASFVPPLQNALEGRPDPAHVELAPRIGPGDRQIDWNALTADDLVLRDRVLGDLWDMQTFARCQYTKSSATHEQRVIFHGPWSKIDTDVQEGPAGQPQLVLGPFRQGLTLGIKTVNGYVVVPQAVTIEGKRKGKGLQPLNDQLRLRRKASRNIFQ